MISYFSEGAVTPMTEGRFLGGVYSPLFITGDCKSAPKRMNIKGKGEPLLPNP